MKDAESQARPSIRKKGDEHECKSNRGRDCVVGLTSYFSFESAARDVLGAEAIRTSSFPIHLFAGFSQFERTYTKSTTGSVIGVHYRWSYSHRDSWS